MKNLFDSIPTHPQDSVWDVVVIGAGAGGATAGYNLARLGRSVLFLERGTLLGQNSAAENTEPLSLERLIDRSWYAQRAGTNSVGGMPDYFTGFGTGGSTAVFSMVMDRFRPIDLQSQGFSQTPSDTSLPESWPIRYEDLEPYYRDAEMLFRVRGTDDPLTPAHGPLLEPPAPSEMELAIKGTLQRAGLHPYPLHYARERVPGCNGCIGKLCPNNCRNDAGRMCIVPALEHHGAQILPECTVTRLDADGRNVRQAIGLWKGHKITIRARVFVLALHALRTPALLLRSSNDSFPDGLGNSSGMIGRNLMLHVSDTVSLEFGELRGPFNAGIHNGLSFNDFYVRDGVKLGNIHLHDWNVSRSSSRSSTTAAFQTIVEDFPYAENRVIPMPGTEDGVRWEYTYRDELRVRSETLVKSFIDAIRPSCAARVHEPTGNLAGHACGTCRFGDDPHTSALDRNNKMHDLDNVYVVDSSFFPSSGGMNPTLTIVANSLRVSTLIAQR